MLSGTSARDSSRLRAVTMTASSVGASAAAAGSAHALPPAIAEPHTANRPSKRANKREPCIVLSPEGSDRVPGGGPEPAKIVMVWGLTNSKRKLVLISKRRSASTAVTDPLSGGLRSSATNSEENRICRPDCWASSLSASASGSAGMDRL